MKTKIVMPQLGESVVDGTVGEWLKQVGDVVEEYEPIVRVNTDKVDTEIPSPASGTLLAIYVQEDETVDSGVLLGIIGDENDTVVEDQIPSIAKVINGKSRSVSNKQQAAHLTPVVARMIQEHQLDPASIPGSGRGGRITKKDVTAYLKTQNNEKPSKDPWDEPVDGDLFKPTVEYGIDDVQQPATKPAPALMPASDISGELVKLSTMRRTIAEHMVRSKLHTSPHVTTVFEIDMTAVLAHRDANKEILAKQGVKLTLTPYFVAASVKALLQYPMVNAKWTDDGIFLHHSTNIGIAVALDEGLIVPVIKNAQDLNLSGLSRQVNDLADRARNRKLQPDEVQGGTFTITNHGVTGSLFATPIINQPQSAILGVGVMEKRVKVISNAIAIRSCVYVSLTFDHRLIDGATGDNFLQTLKHELENLS